MYTAGNAQAGSGVARTSLPVIAAICCGATLLLLLAATIVLALIPLYVPNKTLTKASTTSSQATSYFPVSDSSRKRDQGLNIANATNNAITNTDSLDEIQQNFATLVLKARNTKSVIIDTCSVVQLSGRRRRSDGISKRQSTIQTYIKCIYRVIFADTCTGEPCQTNAGAAVDSIFLTDPDVKKIRLTKLVITIGGISYRFPCSVIGFPKITGLRPAGKGPNNDPNVPISSSGSNPTTAAPTPGSGIG